MIDKDRKKTPIKLTIIILIDFVSIILYLIILFYIPSSKSIPDIPILIDHTILPVKIVILKGVLYTSAAIYFTYYTSLKKSLVLKTGALVNFGWIAFTSSVRFNQILIEFSLTYIALIYIGLFLFLVSYISQFLWKDTINSINREPINSKISSIILIVMVFFMNIILLISIYTEAQNWNHNIPGPAF